ncbi:MAG: nucleoside phosphorylase [Deltaproteobacteria bacterium]|nr:nucleoside phosphorylase [Deltaproteobacteria bacterium]
MPFQSADQVQTTDKKQYHIGLKPGDLAPYILLCGDPARVDKVASRLTETRPAIAHRDYRTVTGKYEGVPVSVMATGMGPDNTEIALVEIAQIIEKATLIRIGSCGGLQKGVELADLVISTGALRLENTTSFYVDEGFPALAHHEVTHALIGAAKALKYPYHVGITATAPGFYAPQGRAVPKFTPRQADLPQKLEKMGVTNLEMEASALFVLSHLAGFRAGCVCAVYANRHANRFIDEATMQKAESRCIETGLKAITTLAKED